MRVGCLVSAPGCSSDDQESAAWGQKQTDTAIHVYTRYNKAQSHAPARDAHALLRDAQSSRRLSCFDPEIPAAVLPAHATCGRMRVL